MAEVHGTCDERFAGGPFDWLTPYTLLVAAGLVAGYALLGGAWLMMKTKDNLHGDARRWTGVSALAVTVLLAAVSVATLLIHPRVAARWGFDLSDGFALELADLLPLLPIPLLGLVGLGIVVVMSRIAGPSWERCWSFYPAIWGWRRASRPTSCPMP